MADYLSRMSLAMSSGNQMNNIVVIEPTTSAWMYFSKNGSNQRFSETASAFTDFINGLEKYQLEYDLGSERNIERFGSSENGKFIIGQRAYGIVVIPPVCDNLDKTTADLLTRFLKDGGKVIDFSNTPGFIDGLPNERVKELAAAYPGQWLKAISLTDSKALNSLSAEGFSVIQPEKIKGKLLHQRRQLTDGQLILLTNTSKDYWSKGSLQVSGKSVSLLDAGNGKIYPYPAILKGNDLIVDFEIPQCGSLLLYISNEKGINEQEVKKEATLKTLEAVSGVKVEVSRPNTLTLDYCDLKFNDGTSDNGLYVVNAGNKIFRHFGFREGNPWSNPQYKTQFADSAKFPENSGFEATYHLTINKGVDVSGFQASVEQAEFWDLSVNGTIVKPIPGKIWLDRHFNQYNIGGLLKEGDNELKLIAAKMTVYSELEAIYIIGKFGLESMDKGFRIVAPKAMEIGSWKGQGLQMYSGNVSYTSNYKISKTGKHFIVALDEWNGTVAEVAVNGKSAGVIYSEPYELDITNYTTEGVNSISVIVYGSLRNLLGPHHSKAAGMAGPGDFASAPKQQPSGYSYNLDDYGLFSNFKVLEVNGEPQQYYRKKDYPVLEKVNEPIITVDKNTSGVSMKKITMSCTTADAEIFYTTDGSAPTINSNRYITPLEFSNSACIKAIAFKNGMQQSNTTVRNIVLGINIINAVYKTPYTKYAAGGLSALFDGERGTENFGDGKWQGFEFNDLDVTFELVKSQAINSISVGFLEQIGSWIYFPSEVEISISSDGKDFKQVGVFTSADFLNNQGEQSKDISVALKDTEARFVRVFARNIGKCPEDDPGSGGKAWLFCDEVIIK
ncbi:MAG: chitobiase/beta-hexosaminidase C-terminal domain-containing protein [Bacteroidales bacterium]|nr:chitobiase/beta-hexosaminidase C-terminal domain-containing protein [Bacteroidales bacterium]